MAFPSFIFDQSKGQTPQSVARQREMVARIMGQIGYRPANSAADGIGSALASIGQGIQGNVLNRRANKAEAEGQASAQSLYDQLVSGIQNGTPITSPGFQPSQASQQPAQDFGGADPQRFAPSMSGATDQSYRDAIASIESAGSGDYSAIGPTNDKLGRALGRYQIMEANVGPWSKAALGREISADEFMANPALQDAIFDNQFGQYVQQYGPEGAAQAWLGGPGGVGKTERQDALGTSIGEYGQRFSQAVGGAGSAVNGMATGGQMPQAPMQVAQAGGPDMQMLLQAASNPWLNEGQRSVVNALLQQQLQGQDPMRALDMDYKRAQIGAMERNASGAPNANSSFGNLDAQARAAGLQPGTPDYQNFMLNGGGAPATFRALDMQARAAGFQPGTPEYNEFMGTRGAGLSAGAAQDAKNLANVATGGDAARVIAAGTEAGKTDAKTADELASIESKMPGLRNVVDRLQGLAQRATYTSAGRLLDATGRELGMEPREGAVARAEYTAIVDNQILPLLRDTFGAQFTAEEGQRLARTLGDPDKSPTEKSALLRAFIEQKERDIQALQNRLGQQPSQGGDGWQDRGNGVKIRRKQ